MRGRPDSDRLWRTVPQRASKVSVALAEPRAFLARFGREFDHRSSHAASSPLPPTILNRLDLARGLYGRQLAKARLFAEAVRDCRCAIPIQSRHELRRGGGGLLSQRTLGLPALLFSRQIIRFALGRLIAFLIALASLIQLAQEAVAAQLVFSFRFFTHLKPRELSPAHPRRDRLAVFLARYVFAACM